MEWTQISKIRNEKEVTMDNLLEMDKLLKKEDKFLEPGRNRKYEHINLK